MRMNSVDWLKQIGFSKYAEMRLDDEKRLEIVKLSHSPNDTPCVPDETPCVYAWVSIDQLPLVLYVGKAGKGIERRLQQHIGGFNNAKKVTRKKKLMLEYFKNSARFDVYFRYSDIQKIFGKVVTLNSAEEHALYLKFSPRWNIATFAELKSGALDSSTELPDPLEEYFSENDIPFDFEDLPYSEDANAFWYSLSMDEKKKFQRIFYALEKLGFTEKLDCRLIGKYTDLGEYSQKNTIAFGLLANVKFKVDSWCARIPLDLPLAIFLPNEILKSKSNHNFIDDNGSSAPSDLDEFCKNPEGYVDLEKLDERIYKAGSSRKKTGKRASGSGAVFGSPRPLAG